MTESKSMGCEERRSAILEILKSSGRATTPQLAEAFGISDVTIRGDLIDMEKIGLLRRVRGGAVSVKKTYYDMSLNDRMNTNKNEKVRIAKACAAMINDGEALMIDSGTTTRYLAMELAERSNLTIVTNSVLVAQEFACSSSVDVILLGGHFNLQRQFSFGNDTVAQLKKYRADKMIIATDGISVKHGLTTHHHQEVDVSRQMAERANQVVALADHSKIGKEGFSYIGPISVADVLVTDAYDDNMPELDAIRQAGVIVTEA